MVAYNLKNQSSKTNMQLLSRPRGVLSGSLAASGFSLTLNQNTGM